MFQSDSSASMAVVNLDQRLPSHHCHRGQPLPHPDLRLGGTMGTRLLRRFRSPVLGSIALVLATGLWAAPAAAAVPPQEPGVTLRVFDLQTPRGDICKLKAGQTPNIDKLMPV